MDIYNSIYYHDKIVWSMTGGHKLYRLDADTLVQEVGRWPSKTSTDLWGKLLRGGFLGHHMKTAMIWFRQEDISGFRYLFSYSGPMVTLERTAENNLRSTSEIKAEVWWSQDPSSGGL